MNNNLRTLTALAVLAALCGTGNAVRANGGSTGVGSGLVNETIFNGGYFILRAPNWTRTEDSATRAKLSATGNEIVFEKVSVPCASTFRSGPNGAQVAECDAHRSVIRSGDVFVEAKYLVRDAEVSGMIDSFMPIFSTGQYRVTIFWNEAPTNEPWPAPYHVGAVSSTMSMTVVTSPGSASGRTADTVMLGYHSVDFNCASSDCGDGGLGYTFTDGFFWFMNNLGGSPHRDFYYLAGKFSNANRGEGHAYLVDPPRIKLADAPNHPPAGRICIDPLETDGSVKVCGLEPTPPREAALY